MKSVGRGRAWSQHRSQQIPGPGRSLSKNGFDCAKIINEVHLISNDGSSTQRVCEIENLISKEEDPENLKIIVNELHKHALRDAEFGRKLITLTAELSAQAISDNGGNTFKKHLIYFMQHDYKRRKELKQESLIQFRNAVRLLCEFYHRIMIRNITPIKVFELPMIDYMEMLLETASLDDSIIIARQVVLHGKLLSTKYKAAFDKFMITVRETLAETTVTKSRKVLLYIIDLVNEKFEPLPSHLQKFYDTHLGVNFVHQHHCEFTDNTAPKTETEETEIFEPVRTEPFDTTIKSEPLEAAKNESFERKSYPSSSSSSRTLRAIRGSGATEVEKYQDQERSYSTKPMASKPSCENKGWGHDDRFTKDYD